MSKLTRVLICCHISYTNYEQEVRVAAGGTQVLAALADLHGLPMDLFHPSLDRQKRSDPAYGAQPMAWAFGTLVGDTMLITGSEAYTSFTNIWSEILAVAKATVSSTVDPGGESSSNISVNETNPPPSSLSRTHSAQANSVSFPDPSTVDHANPSTADHANPASPIPLAADSESQSWRNKRPVRSSMGFGPPYVADLNKPMHDSQLTKLSPPSPKRSRYDGFSLEGASGRSSPRGRSHST